MREFFKPVQGSACAPTYRIKYQNPQWISAMWITALERSKHSLGQSHCQDLGPSFINWAVMAWGHIVGSGWWVGRRYEDENVHRASSLPMKSACPLMPSLKDPCSVTTSAVQSPPAMRIPATSEQLEWILHHWLTFWGAATTSETYLVLAFGSLW